MTVYLTEHICQRSMLTCPRAGIYNNGLTSQYAAQASWILMVFCAQHKLSCKLATNVSNMHFNFVQTIVIHDPCVLVGPLPKFTWMTF